MAVRAMKASISPERSCRQGRIISSFFWEGVLECGRLPMFSAIAACFQSKWAFGRSRRGHAPALQNIFSWSLYGPPPLFKQAAGTWLAFQLPIADHSVKVTEGASVLLE
jgi:hypothetical protein